MELIIAIVSFVTVLLAIQNLWNLQDMKKMRRHITELERKMDILYPWE